jgi:hypothetical protein
MIYRHLCGYLSISLLQTSIVVKYILNLRNESSMLRLPFISTLFKIVEPIGSCHLSICLMRLRRRAPDTKEKLLLTFFSFFFVLFHEFQRKKMFGRQERVFMHSVSYFEMSLFVQIVFL